MVLGNFFNPMQNCNSKELNFDRFFSYDFMDLVYLAYQIAINYPHHQKNQKQSKQYPCVSQCPDKHRLSDQYGLICEIKS